MTLKDIARIVNMSEATVSRALNNHPKISQKTKDLIRKVAEENDFKKNVNAMKLATNKSCNIGIIFPDDFYEFNKRDFFSHLEKYFLINCDKLHYDLLIIRANSLKKSISSKTVDGLIIVNRDLSHDHFEMLNRLKVPYVCVAYTPLALVGTSVPVFKSDNIGCGQDVAKLLVDKGCKNLLTITSNNKYHTDYSDRTAGFCSYLNEKKIKNDVFWCDMTFENGRDLIKNNLEYIKTFDGIFCQQDKVALGILQELRGFNLDLLKDIKLIGHDLVEITDYFEPKLSSIKENFNEITEKALEYLITLIETKHKKNSTGYEINEPFLFKSIIIEKETT